jgi:3-oxoadipate enol-lactonase
VTDGLLLVHGHPMDGTMWEPQLVALRDRVAVVAPHMPGFGGTEPAGDVMTMADGARRCVEALDEAGLDRAVVCGISMGGYIALELWRSARDRVTGFVFANTRAGADDEAGKERRRALAARLRAEGNAFMVENPPPLLSSEAPQELLDRVKGIIAAQPAEAIAAAALGMAERVDSTPDLPGIAVPTLVVTSTGDTLIRPDATRPMAEAIPDAQLELLEGAGHLSNLEAPQEFTRLVEEHLARCGLR